MGRGEGRVRVWYYYIYCGWNGLCCGGMGRIASNLAAGIYAFPGGVVAMGE